MTPTVEDLARRLVACPRFRWMEGMCIASPPELAGLRVVPGSIVSPHALPDLDDAPTVGALLALVREARPAECPAHAARGDSGVWRVWIGERVDTHSLHHHAIGAGPTEPTALVAALEAAP